MPINLGTLSNRKPTRNSTALSGPFNSNLLKHSLTPKGFAQKTRKHHRHYKDICVSHLANWWKFILNDLQLSAHFSHSTAALEITRKSAKWWQALLFLHLHTRVLASTQRQSQHISFSNFLLKLTFRIPQHRDIEYKQKISKFICCCTLTFSFFASSPFFQVCWRRWVSAAPSLCLHRATALPGALRKWSQLCTGETYWWFLGEVSLAKNSYTGEITRRSFSSTY